MIFLCRINTRFEQKRGQKKDKNVKLEQTYPAPSHKTNKKCPEQDVQGIHIILFCFSPYQVFDRTAYKNHLLHMALYKRA